jgi:hypothetical protein
VKGKLEAIGTAELPIQFISSSSTPNKGDWGNIEFRQESLGASFVNGSFEYADGCILSHCIIQHAGFSGAAVSITGTNPYIENTMIRDCNGAGITTSSNWMETLYIHNVTIENNGINGIAFGILHGSVIIKESIVRGHSQNGIRISTGFSSSKIQISHSTIESNGNTGIDFNSAGVLELFKVNVTDHAINNVIVNSGNNHKIIDCYFSNQGDWSVRMQQSTQEVTFSNNVVENSGESVVKFNTIYANIIRS